MRQKNHLISVILVIMISLHCARAGEVRFFDNTSITSHLVTSICQDKEGYVWIGTEYGLNRYDGMVFTHYYTHNNTLVDNYIHDIFLDADGDILIISGRTLQVYNKETGLFDTVAFPEGHVPVLSDVTQLHDGRIVAANSKKGLWLIDKKSMTAESFEVANSKIGAPESQNLLVDSKGRLWICTNNDGIICYDPANDSARHMHVVTDMYTSKGVTGVVENAEGDILVLGMSAFYRYDEVQEDLVRLFSFSPNLSVRRLYIADDGTLYTGSYGKGVYEIDTRRKQVVPALGEITDDYGLGNAGMYSYMDDADGNLWFAFNSKGLLMISGRTQPFDYAPICQINPESGNFLTSLRVLDDGRFVVGQSREGLHLLDSEMRRGRTYLKGYSPISAFQVSDYRIWVGDFTRGACILDLESGEEEWVIKGRRVTDFARDAEGNMYVAIFNGPLVSYTSDGKTERPLGRETGDLTLHGRYLNTLFTDSKGLIWIGHHYGFDVYDPVSDKALDVPCDERLRKAIVYDITESADGVIWLGTSRGLFGYERNAQTWIHKDASDGLICENVCAIRPAEDSSLWLSTYRGLIHYSPGSDSFSYYLQGDGLKEICYVRGVSDEGGDGMFYFGNDLGITSFRPETVTSDSFVRPLKSVTLVAGDKSVDVKDNMIVLSHKENTFALRFSAMDFRNPRNMSFEYSLSSSGQEGWRRTPMGHGEVEFYNLDHGEHVLRVRTVYNESRSEVKDIVIRITPPWYLSGLAKAMYLLLAVAFGVFLWSYWKHRRLAEMNEEKIRLFIDISHEIRSPLTLIKSPLETLMKENHDEKTALALRTIKRNTDRLLLLVNQILSIRKIEKGQMKMHYAVTEMTGFVREYVQDYEYAAAKRKIELTVNGPSDPVVCWIDREQFGKVVSNLVSNALKYVDDGGQVDVSVRTVGKNLEIGVLDNGKGIDEKELRHVFERFYQVSSGHSQSRLGFGIGLNLSSQLVRLHGGVIEARNRSGQTGSEFIVRIPLGYEHLPEDCLVSPEYFADVKDDFKSDPANEDAAKSWSGARKRTDFKVVVVDDDEEIRNFLMDELSKSYYVSVFPDGRQALEAVSDNPPDLVISDISMPQMDGFTLLKRIKNNTATSHVPVILLTTSVDSKSHIEGFGHGADAYVDKPFSIEELMSVSASLIGNRIKVKAKVSGVQEQKGVVKPIELKGNDAALMEKIMACVNRSLCDSDFNVEALADEVGLSRVQLHRRVKDITGITVGEFLRNLRMKQAAELLAKGDVTVSQVTYAVGMSNPTHFTTAFKKYFGVTPTEYLNKHK